MRRCSLALALALIASGPSSLAAQTTRKPATASSRFVLKPSGTEARYVVRELLVANTIENEVIGKTTAVSGGITLDANSKVIAADSRILIDLTTLTTDRERRDGYVQRNTLETAKYPHAVLVVTEIQGLPETLPSSGSLTLTLVGNLTLHGVTRPTTWSVQAHSTPEGMTGTANTALLFSDFAIAVPRVPVVARVDDPIRLELDFSFVRTSAVNANDAPSPSRR